MDAKGNNVRLTQTAHELLAKRTEGTGISMKDAASEAVLLMFKQKQDKRQASFCAFVLGSIAGGTLMFVIGLVV